MREVTAQELFSVAKSIVRGYHNRGHFDSLEVSEDDIEVAYNAVCMIYDIFVPMYLITEAKKLLEEA